MKEPINRPPEKGSEQNRTPADDEGPAAQRVAVTEADFDGYTNRARDIFDLARARSASRGSSFSSTRSLLVAFLAAGKREAASEDRGSPAWLWAEVRAQRKTLERAAHEHYPDGLSLNLRPGSRARGMTNEISSDLAAVLADARRLLGRDADGRPEVGARHLLGSLLAPRPGEPSNSDKMLRAAGVSLPRLRRAFLASLEKWRFGDDLAKWRELLTSPGSEDRVLSGYTADDVAGDDLIGITREVEAMASLAAAWSVEPPLSIGLFGEWGSGKSFFMQKMKDRVRAIASAARASALSQKKFGYYKNIVQVEFNAWHYVEGSLWAGLVEHIFQNLRVFDSDAEEEIAKRQRKLFEELRTVQTTKEAAEQATAKLASEHAAKEQKRLDLEQEQRDAEERASAARAAVVQKAQQKRAVTARDVVREIYDSAQVRTQVAALLGLKEAQLATPDDVRAAVTDAAEGWSTLRDAWRIVTRDRGSWRILVWVLAVPVAIAAIGWVASSGSGRIAELVGSIGTALSTVLGLAAGGVAAWKRFAPQLEPLLDTARKVRETRDRIELRVEEAKRDRDEQVLKLDAEADEKRQEAATADVEAKTKALEAQKAAEDAEAARLRIDDIRKQLEELRPERMIASFIQDRAGADDYRKHLGVPALIRRDFEKLSRLFRTQRKEEDAERDGLGLDGNPLPSAGTAADGNPLPARNDPTVVNRIILYVDDLDRCPPEKVVEVLRAIHLLLAFPLFVVVVAVDARWVRRALKDQFKLMLASSDESAAETAGNGASPATERATTDDYLEKIFQVAFWLRPLGDTGSRDLLLNLVPQSDPLEDDEEAGSSDEGDDHPPEPGHGEDETQAAHVQSIVHAPKPAWTAVTASPKTLAITSQERSYMLELAPIVGRSPRAVKRFLNCYRLIKAMLEPEELDRFAPDAKGARGDFHATMLLLGAVSGAPQLATVILDSIDTTTAKSADAWLNELKVASSDDDWKRVEPLLASLAQATKLDGAGSWREAAGRVDRFAFTPIRTRAETNGGATPSAARS